MVAFAQWVRRAQVRDGDPATGLTVVGFRVYARLVHGLEVSGLEHVPPRGSGPLIIVANHTAGVDPVLVQTVVPDEVRWMMAADMRASSLEFFWGFARIIFVERGSRTGGPGLREAIRHVREGGVLGIFPEGHIERPPRTLLPFQPGVGLIVKRTGAEVLPVVIDGTPQTETAWGSLWRPSRSSLRFLPRVRYGGGTSPGAIVEDLLERFASATGWPTTTRAPIMSHDPPLFVDLEGRYVDESGRVWADDEVGAVRAVGVAG